MKTLKSLVCGAVLSLAVGAQADLVPIDANLLDGALGSPESEALWIEGKLPLTPGSLIYLNKYDVATGWDNGGAVGDSAFTADIGADTRAGTVSWDLTGTDYQLAYVLVKSGQAEYMLYGVTPDQVITSGDLQDVVSNTKNPEGPGISHVSFFGTPRTDVPDAGTSLLLLSAGVLGLGAMRRKLN
jgi:hypothetical protein